MVILLSILWLLVEVLVEHTMVVAEVLVV